MRRSSRFKVLWTVWMAGGGLTASAIAYAVTEDWRWALGALLRSGPVLNTVGQMIVQPFRAAGGRHPKATA